MIYFEQLQILAHHMPAGATSCRLDSSENGCAAREKASKLALQNKKLGVYFTLSFFADVFEWKPRPFFSLWRATR